LYPGVHSDRGNQGDDQGSPAPGARTVPSQGSRCTERAKPSDEAEVGRGKEAAGGPPTERWLPQQVSKPTEHGKDSSGAADLESAAPACLVSVYDAPRTARASQNNSPGPPNGRSTLIRSADSMRHGRHLELRRAAWRESNIYRGRECADTIQ